MAHDEPSTSAGVWAVRLNDGLDSPSPREPRSQLEPLWLGPLSISEALHNNSDPAIQTPLMYTASQPLKAIPL